MYNCTIGLLRYTSDQASLLCYGNQLPWFDPIVVHTKIYSKLIFTIASRPKKKERKKGKKNFALYIVLEKVTRLFFSLLKTLRNVVQRNELFHLIEIRAVAIWIIEQRPKLKLKERSRFCYVLNSCLQKASLQCHCLTDQILVCGH